jgi:hypothetical protein
MTNPSLLTEPASHLLSRERKNELRGWLPDKHYAGEVKQHDVVTEYI